MLKHDNNLIFRFQNLKETHGSLEEFHVSHKLGPSISITCREKKRTETKWTTKCNEKGYQITWGNLKHKLHEKTSENSEQSNKNDNNKQPRKSLHREMKGCQSIPLCSSRLASLCSVPSGPHEFHQGDYT